MKKKSEQFILGTPTQFLSSSNTRQSASVSQHAIRCRCCRLLLIDSAGLAFHLETTPACRQYYCENRHMVRVGKQSILEGTLRLEYKWRADRRSWCLIGLTPTGMEHICRRDRYKDKLKKSLAQALAEQTKH